jgi:hypothetical protein
MHGPITVKPINVKSLIIIGEIPAIDSRGYPLPVVYALRILLIPFGLDLAFKC